MAKRIVVGVLLAVVAALLLACQVRQEAEDTDVTPTLPVEASATAQPSSTAPPTPTLTAELAELERLRQEEATKPQFDGVINGIRLYPYDAKVVPTPQDACTDAKPEEVQHVDVSAAAGTPLEIVPTYLPAGAEEGSPGYPSVVCKGTVAFVEREWGIPGKGYFFIDRYQGEHAFAGNAPAERISAGIVRGRPAVLVKPLLEGYDNATVIVAEEFGYTVVGLFGLPFEEAVRIAEGLK